MLEIDYKGMFQQAVKEAERYSTSNIKKEVNNDSGELVLSTKKYQLKVLINDRWVGYEFALDRQLTGGIAQGDSIDTDLYPLGYDIERTEYVFQETIAFIKSLLENKLFYGTVNKKAVFAKPIKSNMYKVIHVPKRRFFANIILEEWPSQQVVNTPDLHRLVANE